MANLSNINNKFLVTTTGEVLIGQTSNNGNRLQITGADGASYIYLKTNVATTGGRIGFNGSDLRVFNQQASGELNLGTAGTTRLTIDSSGNTTITATTNQRGLFVINATDNTVLGISNTGTNGQNWRLTSTGGSSSLGAGKLLLKVGSTETAANIISFVTGGSGADIKMGIGTDSPNAKLEVASGQAKTVTSGVEFARFGTSNEVSEYATLACEVKGAAAAADRKWIFQTIESGVANAGNIAFQPSGGNVGIGTTSPISGFKLDVQGGDFRVGDDANQGFEAGYSAGGGLVFLQGYNRGTNAFVDMSINNSLTVLAGGNVGIGVTSPAGKLEVAGGSTLGLRLSNVGDQSAYDQVRMTYSGYNSGAPTVTFMPLTTPGSGNAYTTFLFQNTNGINASSNNNANVAIDGTLQVGKAKGTGETTLIMNNYDATLVDAGSIQNSIRMSGRYWSGSASQLVETRINSVHQESNGNGGSALTFWTQTGGDAATEQMRIDKVGNVGIGVTPTQKLDVAGIVKHQGLEMTAGVQVDQTTLITKTLTGTANTWRPTGIDGTDIPSAGSYLLQVFSDDHSGAGPANYSWYWTGTMSWYAGATNNNVTSEIYLQGCGHHTNMVLELRTKVNYNSAGIPFAELEWKSATSFVNSPNWYFRFRRLI